MVRIGVEMVNYKWRGVLNWPQFDSWMTNDGPYGSIRSARCRVAMESHRAKAINNCEKMKDEGY